MKTNEKLQEALDGLNNVLETLEKSMKKEPLDKEVEKDEDEDTDKKDEPKKGKKVEKEEDESENPLMKSIENSLLQTANTLNSLNDTINQRFTELEGRIERTANIASVPRSIQGITSLQKSLNADSSDSVKVSQNTQEGRSIVKQALINVYDKAEGDLQKSLGRELLGFDAAGKLSESTISLIKEKTGLEIL